MSESLTEKEYQDMRGRRLNQEESRLFTREWFRRNPGYGKFHGSLNKPRFKRKRVCVEIDLETLPYILSIDGREVRLI